MKAEGIDQLYSEMRRSKLRASQKRKKKERSESSKLGKRASETKLDGRDHASGRGRMDRGPAAAALRRTADPAPPRAAGMPRSTPGSDGCKWLKMHNSSR